MVNIQQWLDSHYPKENRKNITELNISNNNLEGELELKGFDNLKRLNCHGNKFTKLDIDNCFKLEKLDCSDNELTSLDLSKCVDLTELNCSFNKLKDLDFPKSLKKLKRFSCSDNYLTCLNYSLFNANKLIYFNIADNNFLEQDLSDVSELVNLKLLWIGNDNEDKIDKNIYNKFYGSLKSLKELKNLESLNISNTDINGGLECLSTDSMKYIYCSFKQRPESKVKEISKQSSIFLIDEDEGKYGSKNWINHKTNDMANGIKNVLVVGKTNSGKSALANVLVNKNNTFKEVFKENPYSSNKPNENKEIQTEKFEHGGVKYRVIDIGSTYLAPDELLLKTVEAIYSAKGRINQIFLTSQGDNEFTKEEGEGLELLKTVFGNDIVNYITVVRTKFINFGEEGDCSEDKKTVISNLNWFYNDSINVINVDNPPLSGHSTEKDKETRRESRTKLLNYLKDNCQKDYKLDNSLVRKNLLTQLRAEIQVAPKGSQRPCPIL